MNTHGIRHLPVLEKGVLTGVITEKDIKLAKTLNSQWDWKCEDVLTPNPRIVAPDAPIHRVLLEMAKTKDEYALIQHPSGNIIGIFTQIDAYLILARLLADFSEEQGITHNA
jgi:acetoin utilization protein AcuB